MGCDVGCYPAHETERKVRVSCPVYLTHIAIHRSKTAHCIDCHNFKLNANTLLR